MFKIVGLIAIGILLVAPMVIGGFLYTEDAYIMQGGVMRIIIFMLCSFILCTLPLKKYVQFSLGCILTLTSLGLAVYYFEMIGSEEELNRTVIVGYENG